MRNFPQQKVYEFGDFRLDAGSKLLYRSGEQVSLSPRAIETLIALVERQGEVVAKDELMHEIWGDTIVEESNLAQYLHFLRKALGKTHDGKPFIETLKRRGYRFNGVVRLSGNSPQALNGTGPFSAAPRAAQIERRGNVLALADWREGRDLNEKAADTGPQRSRSVLLALAILLVAIAVVMAFSFSGFTLRSATADREASRKNELTIVPLTNAEVVGQATISPDGKYFVYTEYEGTISRLWLQQIGEASRAEIIRPFRGIIVGLSFARDSASVYFVGWREGDTANALYRVPTLGGQPLKILSGIDQAVSFSPDGNEMVFVRRDAQSDLSQIVISATDGSHERVLLNREDSERIEPNAAWSPDGKLIAFGLLNYQAGACSIVGIDHESGAIQELSSEKWDSCNRTAWTHDGEGLVFIGTKYKEALTTRRDQIYYLSVASGESHRLTSDGNRHEPMTLGVTDADDVLALPFNRVSQIWSLDADSDQRTAQQITRGLSDGKGGIEMLPDGKIVFLSRAGDGFGIFCVNVDGIGERQQIMADLTMEELRAAPDGRFLVYAAKKDGRAHLFRVAPDGSGRTQLTFGDSTETDSAVSPDGNWVVYASAFFEDEKLRYALRKIPAEGGDAVHLLDQWCGAPHYSPDGRTISCIDGDRIRLISAENGATVNTFDTAAFSFLNTGARFTPDGEYLVYKVQRSNVVNLWHQPVKGGEPRELTKFVNGEIYNFTFAPDGSRLYLARGNPIRHAILIRDFK